MNDKYKAEIRDRDEAIERLQENMAMRMDEINKREQILDERERMLVERESALKKKK